MSLYAETKLLTRTCLDDFDFLVGSKKVRNFRSVQQAVNVFQESFFLKLRVGDQEYRRLVETARVLQQILQDNFF